VAGVDDNPCHGSLLYLQDTGHEASTLQVADCLESFPVPLILQRMEVMAMDMLIHVFWFHQLPLVEECAVQLHGLRADEAVFHAGCKLQRMSILY